MTSIWFLSNEFTYRGQFTRALAALRGWGLVDNGSKPVKRPSLFGGIGGRRRRTRYREAGGIAQFFCLLYNQIRGKRDCFVKNASRNQR
jgi:hypothetical protein